MIKEKDIKVGTRVMFREKIAIEDGICVHTINFKDSIARYNNRDVFPMTFVITRCDAVCLVQLKPEHKVGCLDYLLVTRDDLTQYATLEHQEEDEYDCGEMLEMCPKHTNGDRNNAIATEGARLFEKITVKMLDMYKAKNHDYGNSFSELFVECGMPYAYGHMAEKLKRVKSLMNCDGKVEGESMKDSLYDLANYAILTIMEIEKKK